MPEPASIVKCLVWDLDNTLWKGTLIEGDQVFIEDEIRRLVQTLDARGILQSIASKNDHDDAWNRLDELGIADYFLFPEIGWHPKSESIRRIAEQLNFAHNKIAFVDDQTSERAEVAFHLPDIRCYSHEQLANMMTLPEFSPAVVTVDASRRRKMYQSSQRRNADRQAFQGTDDEFLRTLDLVLQIQRCAPHQLSRVEELTLRTSQMNATGVHYSEEILRGLCLDPNHEVLLASLDDRFGSHGAIGVVLLAKNTSYWHLKLLATSCRVISFGVGATIMNWLISQAADADVHLVADFRPTKRNRIMEITYRFLGFDDTYCECYGVLRKYDKVQRMHIVPNSRKMPHTMQLIAPDLGLF